MPVRVVASPPVPRLRMPDITCSHVCGGVSAGASVLDQKFVMFKPSVVAWVFPGELAWGKRCLGDIWRRLF